MTSHEDVAVDEEGDEDVEGTGEDEEDSRAGGTVTVTIGTAVRVRTFRCFYFNPRWCTMKSVIQFGYHLHSCRTYAEQLSSVQK